MIIKKTADELNEAMQAALVNNTQITYMDRGSIARALIEIINNAIEDYYETLEYNVLMAFVSTAEGRFLDLIGRLLDCNRRSDEADNNYRYRITQQIYVVARANETAVRLSCLAVENVRDIVMIPYAHGAGSFMVYVDVIDKNRVEDTIERVQEVIDDVQAYGVRGEAILPKMVMVDLSARLTFSEKISEQRASSLRSETQQEIKNYIDNLNIGQSMIASQLIHVIMRVDKVINSVDFSRLALNNRPTMVTNKKARWNEQFVPRHIKIT